MKVKLIQVFEYSTLIVGHRYGLNDIEFTKKHFDHLARYLTLHQTCSFYTVYYDRVKFNQYVGVIQVDGLTIEVLPKTDKHTDDAASWQQVLIQMLQISLQVSAKTTTTAAVNVRNLNVLETYLLLYVMEVEKLLHEGLIKRYRTHAGNQNALKGRLIVSQQVTRNLVHAERFYLAHQVYDRDNIFNGILFEALACIKQLTSNSEILGKCSALLLNFPDCSRITASEKIFYRLTYDRKSERYRRAIELARIILLNYHPDVKGGANNILAIMVDMNHLWENYIYYILKRACRERGVGYNIYAQQKALFWQHPDNWSLRLKPDLILQIGNNRVVLDTKWKYKSATSVEDIRQMYTYGHYFQSRTAYLLYPDNLSGNRPVEMKNGNFYDANVSNALSMQKCGLIWLDLLDNNKLELNRGIQLLENLDKAQ